MNAENAFRADKEKLVQQAENFGSVVGKLQECLNALKDSMIHNFVYI
jgi:hypothetical protein